MTNMFIKGDFKMGKENLFEDLQDVIGSSNVQNKECVLIYKENMDFFREIITDHITFEQGADPPTLFIYMNISNLKKEDMKILEEYKDYLLLLGVKNG